MLQAVSLSTNLPIVSTPSGYYLYSTSKWKTSSLCLETSVIQAGSRVQLVVSGNGISFFPLLSIATKISVFLNGKEEIMLVEAIDWSAVVTIVVDLSRKEVGCSCVAFVESSFWLPNSISSRVGWIGGSFGFLAENLHQTSMNLSLISH